MDSVAVTALSCFGGLPPANRLYTKKAVAARLVNARIESRALGQKAVCLLRSLRKWAVRPVDMAAAS